MLCNTRSQKNCHSTIRVNLNNVKGSHSIWLKFAFKRFVILEDFLINMVVKIDTLFVSTKQGTIDQLVSLGKNYIPICKKRDFERHILRECKSSRRGLQQVETVECKVCMTVARVSSTSSAVRQCLWWLGRQKCFQYSCNSLMYLLANGIGLWILICDQN